jgi:hypothetical protein
MLSVLCACAFRVTSAISSPITGASSLAVNQRMRAKSYRVRGQAKAKGKVEFDLALEFEGKRAFVVWESISFGNYQLKARVEIDPKFLRAEPGPKSDFIYNGELVLPNPENN